MTRDIDIDTNFSNILPKDDENPPEFVPIPKTKDENKIGFSPNNNIKSPTDFDFKPFMFDVSSYFGLLIVYNETLEQVEAFDIRQNFNNEFKDEECAYIEYPRQIIWSYMIARNKFHSLKMYLIDSEEYPLVCINSTDGIQILTLKECTKYQKININNGGNMITKWSTSRPNDLVNLSSNHTLFIFTLDEFLCEFISSNVSCFIITNDGEILFVRENKLYLYDKTNKISSKKTVFSNNIIMTNTFNDTALIISKTTKKVKGKEDKQIYILSLYDYRYNEIKSFSTKYNLDINEKNICSSIYSSIVIIGLAKKSRFLYFNCESLEKFSQIKLKKNNTICIEKDEKGHILPISGIEFINSNLCDYCTCPSIISFFGSYAISLISIEPFLYEIDPEKSEEAFVPYEKIKKIENDYIQIVNVDVSKRD